MIANVSQPGHALIVGQQVGFAGRLRLARIAAGLDVDDIARAIGVSKRTYQRLEDGSRQVRPLELTAIAQLTGQDVEFFGASPDRQVEAPNLSLLPGAVNHQEEG
jgi:transcriptional regulator with XRE-family HTH domain